MLLFNPRTYRGGLADAHTNDMLQAVIYWFEKRGLERLKADYHDRAWNYDFVDFMKSGQVLARALEQDPLRAAGRGPGLAQLATDLALVGLDIDRRPRPGWASANVVASGASRSSSPKRLTYARHSQQKSPTRIQYSYARFEPTLLCLLL